MAYTFKPFQELNITDDYMFGLVMRQEQNVKPFLESVLGRPILRIQYADVQKDIPAAYEMHGVRLDVYIQDEAGKVYDIEMQTTTQKALEKRARYYHSSLDRWQLEKGTDYPELHDTIVIFILMSDYFGEGYAMYEPRTTITAESETRYESGARTIFLNADYRIPNADRKVLDFLDYAMAKRSGKTLTIRSDYIQSVDNAVAKAKMSQIEEVAYMTWKIKLEDERRMGREEGIGIGRSIGRTEGIGIGRTEGISIGRTEGERSMLKKLIDAGIISEAQAKTILQG